jgi:methylated-DNA-[protein]-cysteine S-methyltransferase
MRRKRSLSTKSFYDIVESPIGTLYLVFTGKILRGVAFKKPDEILRKGEAPSLIKKELREYFEKGRDEFTQKIGFTKGTEFDKKVWLTLKEIPYGDTRTYKWLAEKIGKIGAWRAVGQALSRNPLPILLPCHRIIESDGTIGGYSSGIDIKRRLLEIEYYNKVSKERLRCGNINSMELEVGRIAHFYKKIGVAVVELSGPLQVGDTIHISGHTTDLTQKVESMQMEHQNIQRAEKGQGVGLKVNGQVKEKDIVYKVTD